MGGPIVGIDLGTTNSCAAVVEDGSPAVIPSRGGHRTMPSMVAVGARGNRLVGHVAKRQAITNPEHTAFAVKRFIGRGWDSDAVRAAAAALPYKIVDGGERGVSVVLRDQTFSLPELSAFVLSEMKRVAEEYLGREVRRAVVTVPAYFNDSQRQATKDAARIAHLEAVRVLNEPTAAALAYGFGRDEADRTIAVYDLGGGTFDISVMAQRGGSFEVLASAGDTLLGGEDFDGRLIDRLARRFQDDHGIDLRKDRMALQRLKDAAEKAKLELSSVTETRIDLPFIATGADGKPLHLQASLDRGTLEELTVDLVDDTIRTCRAVLADAKREPSAIDEVILVGGMTRMPRVERAVTDFFERPPCKGVHPDEAVALGAAIYAAALERGDAETLLGDVTSHSLGILVDGGRFLPLIRRNARLPISAAKAFTTTRDDQTAVDVIILQGEDEDGSKNHCLGRFTLAGLRPLPRGAIDVEVTFGMSTDGVVGVSAKDRDTGVEQAVQVSPSSGLSEAEIGKMAEDSHRHALVERIGEERSRKHQSVEKMAREVEQLFPNVLRAMAQTTMDWSAIRSARTLINRARAVTTDGDDGDLDVMAQDLAQTVKAFRALAAQVVA